MLDVALHYVTAKHNGDDGAFIAGLTPEILDSEVQPFAENLFEFLETNVHIVGGYYGYNHDHGINVDAGLAAEFGFVPEALNFYAKEVHAVGNKDSGLVVGRFFDEPGGGGGDPGDAVAESNGEENGIEGFLGSRIEIIKGVYSENGLDGLQLSSFGLDLGIEAGPQVQLHYVDATNNLRNGLSFQGGLFEFAPTIQEFNGNGDYSTLIDIYGGNYSYNARNGIDIRTVTFGDGGEFGEVGTDSRVALTDVYANYNGRDGLELEGFFFSEVETVTNGGTFVDIERGKYNRNGRDGINIADVGLVQLDQTRGIANGDNGLDVFNAFDVELGGSVFEDNGNDDIVIDD